MLRSRKSLPGFEHQELGGPERAHVLGERVSVPVDHQVARVRHPRARPALQGLDAQGQVVGEQLVIVGDQDHEIGLGALDEPVVVLGALDRWVARPVHQARVLV